MAARCPSEGVRFACVFSCLSFGVSFFFVLRSLFWFVAVLFASALVLAYEPEADYCILLISRRKFDERPGAKAVLNMPWLWRHIPRRYGQASRSLLVRVFVHGCCAEELYGTRKPQSRRPTRVRYVRFASPELNILAFLSDALACGCGTANWMQCGLFAFTRVCLDAGCSLIVTTRCQSSRRDVLQQW